MKIILFVLFTTNWAHANLKIIIDPGHGGFDRGAVYGSAQESKIVLQIARLLKTTLEKNHQMDVALTRQEDRHLSLTDRVRQAEKAQADLFISLHANAATDARARGLEFFIQESWNQEEALSQTDDDLSKKAELANILSDLKNQNRFSTSLKISRILAENLSGHIKQGPFYVISKTSMPAVLIEVGFLSHNRDYQQLVNPVYQKTLAEKMANSIKQFCIASGSKYAKVGACEMMVDKKIN
ncbi:MAG: N-acetylmuramoyl-L-alanine amidase [Bdellovibrionota bacterium]